jgi:hypothetical protein
VPAFDENVITNHVGFSHGYTQMSGERSHLTEWAEFVDAEVPESELSGDHDRSPGREQ